MEPSLHRTAVTGSQVAVSGIGPAVAGTDFVRCPWPSATLSLGECNVVIGRVQRRKADFNTTKPVSVLENGVGCMGLVVVSQGDRI